MAVHWREPVNRHGIVASMQKAASGSAWRPLRCQKTDLSANESTCLCQRHRRHRHIPQAVRTLDNIARPDCVCQHSRQPHSVPIHQNACIPPWVFYTHLTEPLVSEYTPICVASKLYEGLAVDITQPVFDEGFTVQSSAVAFMDLKPILRVPLSETVH